MKKLILFVVLLCGLSSPALLFAQDAGTIAFQGYLALGRGHYDEAIELFTRSIGLDPNYIAAYGNRGIAYIFKSDYDRALADFNQMIRIGPNNSRGYIHRGVLYERLGDNERARADYDNAIRILGRAQFYFDRGIVKGNFNNNDAIEDFTRAIELNPNNVRYYVARGNTYRKIRDYRSAYADLSEAHRLDPNDTGADISYNSAIEEFRRLGLIE